MLRCVDWYGFYICSPVSVPGAATTVLCAPDDGRDRRPKHVE